MEQLKKCPFCGGEVGIFETHEHRFEIWHKEEDEGVECPLGATECVGGWIYDTKEHAIAAWNTRKPMERIVERLEEYRDDFMNDIYEELREDSDNLRANRIIDRFDDAIEIVKEEMS